LFRHPLAKTDFQRHFGVSPPSVHQIIVTLERNGLTLALTATRTGADVLPSSFVPAAR
jgi:DNA-binding IclR family transcriptional regulator